MISFFFSVLLYERKQKKTALFHFPKDRTVFFILKGDFIYQSKIYNNMVLLPKERHALSEFMNKSTLLPLIAPPVSPAKQYPYT